MLEHPNSIHVDVDFGVDAEGSRKKNNGLFTVRPTIGVDSLFI